MKIVQDERYHEQGFHNFEDNLTQPRHRWYPFKEGYSSELVMEAIKSQLSGQTRTLRILDPFCGSGTTPVTAALEGHTAHAIEVNPFCAFTSRVKCLPGRWQLRAYGSRLEQIVDLAYRDRRTSPLENQSTFSEGAGKEKWLFNRTVLRAFAATWRKIPATAGSYSSAFQLAAIRAAMDCCNAKKDGKALRYYKDWKQRAYDAEAFFTRFRIVASQFCNDTELAPIGPNANAHIQGGDARKSLIKLRANQYDLVVTSPPYLNSFDYSDVYRPELFLGQFVESNLDLRQIRLRTLRSHLQVNWGGETAVKSDLLVKPLEELKAAQTLWNHRLPEMVQAYFHDMHLVLKQIARLLKIGAEAWIVVSTSAYAGVHIPVDLILAELGTNTGLELKGVYAMRALRAAGQQQDKFGTDGLPLRESLIVLKRSV